MERNAAMTTQATAVGDGRLHFGLGQHDVVAAGGLLLDRPGMEVSGHGCGSTLVAP